MLAAFSAQLAISVIKDPVNLDLSLILSEIGGDCTVLFEAYGRNRDTCYTSSVLSASGKSKWNVTGTTLLST